MLSSQVVQFIVIQPGLSNIHVLPLCESLKVICCLCCFLGQVSNISIWISLECLYFRNGDWGVESRESSGGGNAFSIRECTENFGVQEATYCNAEDLS